MGLRIYLRMLQSGWWLIILAALAALNVSLVASSLVVPAYQATARLLITPNVEMIKSSSDQVDSLTALDRPSIVATYAQVLQSDRMFRETTLSLGADPEQLVKTYAIVAVVLPDANVIQLSATGPDPALAAALVNNISQRTIDYVNSVYRVFTMGFIDMARVPDTPIRPQPVRDAGVAVVLGLGAGVLLVLAREQLLVTIESLRAQHRLDGDSQAYERRYFERLLEQESRKSEESLALGIIHLGGVEDLEETLPRPVLQTILRHVTQTLANELRGNDVVARWTNTKFAVLLPSTAGAGASRVLDRIRSALSEPISLEGGDSVLLEPHIGVGVRQNEETAQELIKRAEQALMQSRRNGEGVTVVSS